MGVAFCVSEGLDDGAREALMWRLARAGAAWCAGALGVPRDGPDAARAAWCLETAQRAGYRPDPPACEWYQTPDVTVVRGGDCDDLVILLAALATAAGLECAIARIPQPQGDQDHVLCRLWVDGAWRWAEPSIAGARLGEHPEEALRRLGHTNFPGSPTP